MTGSTVGTELRTWPFGKYQGQPIDRVMTDQRYIEWVLNQPWFAEDYSNIRALILNFGNEAQESPEHNAFQIRFLEEDVRLAVARRLGFQELDGDACNKKKAIAKRVAKELGCAVNERQSPLAVSPVRFEEQGWDVAFDVLPASYVSFLDAKHGKDYVALLESWGKPKLAAMHQERIKAHHATLDVAVYEPNAVRKVQVKVELKPDLGDDYPSVLRQIQRYAAPADAKKPRRGRTAQTPLERKVLIVRRARFTTVTFEQVKAFFASADVELMLELELEDFAHTDDTEIDFLEELEAFEG